MTVPAAHPPLDYTQQDNRYHMCEPLPPADETVGSDGRVRFNIVAPHTYTATRTIHVSWVTVDALPTRKGGAQ